MGTIDYRLVSLSSKAFMYAVSRFATTTSQIIVVLTPDGGWHLLNSARFQTSS